MPSWIPAAVAGGLSLIGGERRNRSAEREGARNRSFQERLSSSAYQRAMADMRAGGLNPILAAKVGGASSPGGAMAQYQDVVTPAVNSALNANQSIEQANLIRETVREKTEQVAQATHQAEILGYESSYKKWFMDLDLESREQAVKIAREEVKLMQRRGEIAATTAGQILAWLKEITGAVLGGGSLVPRR